MGVTHAFLFLFEGAMHMSPLCHPVKAKQCQSWARIAELDYVDSFNRQSLWLSVVMVSRTWQDVGRCL